MPIKEAEELWPTGPEVLLTLEEAVQMAEEMSAPPAERWVARTISDKLIPSLYEARTYIEVGQLKSPEIRLGISRAALEAGGLKMDQRFDGAVATGRSLLRFKTAHRPKRSAKSSRIASSRATVW